MFALEKGADAFIHTVIRKNVRPQETEAGYWDRHWDRQREDFRQHGVPLETRDAWWKNLYDEMADHYEHALDGVAGKRICELGAGSGFASLLLAKRGATITLVDFSPNSHAYAKELASYYSVPRERVAFQLQDMLSAAVPTDRADVVWNCGVIEHYAWPDAVRMVRTMAAHAKPGGTVMVTLPNLLSPELIYRMCAEGKGTEIFFSHRMLRRLMEEAGLQNVRVAPINYWVPSFLPHAWANRMRRSSFGRRLAGLCWLFNGIGTVPNDSSAHP